MTAWCATAAQSACPARCRTSRVWPYGSRAKTVATFSWPVPGAASSPDMRLSPAGGTACVPPCCPCVPRPVLCCSGRRQRPPTTPRGICHGRVQRAPGTPSEGSPSTPMQALRPLSTRSTDSPRVSASTTSSPGYATRPTSGLPCSAGPRPGPPITPQNSTDRRPPTSRRDAGSVDWGAEAGQELAHWRPRDGLRQARAQGCWQPSHGQTALEKHLGSASSTLRQSEDDEDDRERSTVGVIEQLVEGPLSHATCATSSAPSRKSPKSAAPSTSPCTIPLLVCPSRSQALPTCRGPETQAPSNHTVPSSAVAT